MYDCKNVNVFILSSYKVGVRLYLFVRDYEKCILNYKQVAPQLLLQEH